MKTNEMIYRNEINVNPDYKTTKEDFIEWLYENNEVITFAHEIEHIEDDSDRFAIAVDYSIPVTMVRYFEMHFGYALVIE